MKPTFHMTLFTGWMILFGLVLALSHPAHGQAVYPENVDLGIRFNTEPQTPVKINGLYAATIEVYMEENTTDIPGGEIVVAKVQLLDPDGLPVDAITVDQQWPGFSPTTDGFIETSTNNADLFTFLIPWSQQSKWSADAEWTILAQVFSPALDRDATNNTVERKVRVLMPDLALSNLQVRAVDPKTGLLSSNFVTNTNYSVSGTIENVGEVMTQHGIYASVVAELINTETGSVMDRQSILIPDTELPFASATISPDGQLSFSIDNLYLNAEQGTYTNYEVQVTVNPQDLTGGPAMKEQGYGNNSLTAAVTLDSSQNNASIVAANSYL